MALIIAPSKSGCTGTPVIDPVHPKLLHITCPDCPLDYYVTEMDRHAAHQA